MLLSDYIAQVQFLLHDQTNRDFSQAELTTAVNNARTAVALDFQCIRQTFLSPPNAVANPSFYNAVNIIPQQEVYSLNGQPGNSLGGVVVGATINNGGSGYGSDTTATFSLPGAPAGAVVAQGTPVITGGVITGINMTRWGSGYNTAVAGLATYNTFLPTISFGNTGGGIGASATPVMMNNVFNVLSISNLWGNQRYMLKYRAFTLFQAYMRSQLFFRQRPVIWTIQEEMGLVLIQPPPDQNYNTEWDTIAVAEPLVSLTDNDTQIIAPANDAVQYYAAQYCMTKLQNFGQAQYLMKLYEARVPKIIIGKNGVRIPNPYNKTFMRRVMR